MGFIRLACLWAIACAMLVACGDDAKKLHVSLVTDLTPRAEFAAVEVLLTKGENEDARHAVGRSTQDVAHVDSFARGRAVADFGELATGHYTARLSLIDRRGERVATALRTFDLQDNGAITVTIERACVDVVCPLAGNAAATACRAGRCVEPECVDEDTTNDARCPPGLVCGGASDCPDVAMCADRACTGGYCIPVTRTASCDDESYCDARTGCEPVDATEPSAPRECNTVCRVDADGCLYGYLRCVDETTTMCSQIVRRAAGTPCRAGVCDETGACVPAVNVDAGVDAEVDDASVDAGIDATMDAGVDAAMDAAVDAAPDMAVPTLVVENVGANGLVSFEPSFDRSGGLYSLNDEWFARSAQFEVSISPAPSGPVVVSMQILGSDLTLPAACTTMPDSAIFHYVGTDFVQQLRMTIGPGGATTPLLTCALAYLDYQRDGDRDATVRFEVLSAPIDPELFGVRRDFAVTTRDVDAFRVATRPGSLVDWNSGGVAYCPTTASIAADGETIVFASNSESGSPFAGQLGIPGADYDDEASVLTVDAFGMPGNGVSTDPSVSADGRFVAFLSTSTNFVALPSGSPSVAQTYVLDRTTGEYEVVSGIYSAGVLTEVGNAASGTNAAFPIKRASTAISEDGRYVAFASFATNLVTGVPMSQSQIYVFDRATKTIELASVDEFDAPIGFLAPFPSISSDGRRVAFATLVPSTFAGIIHTFVRDLDAGTTTTMDVTPSGVLGTAHSGYWPVISGDGEWVVFSSASDLTAIGDISVARTYRRLVDDESSLEVLPATPMPAGGQIYYAHHAVSSDGSRASYQNWTQLEPSGAYLDAMLWSDSAPSMPMNTTESTALGFSEDGSVVFVLGLAETPSGDARLLGLSRLGEDDDCMFDVLVGDFPRP